MKRTLLIILILGAIGSFSYWKREGLINRLSQLKQQAPKVSSYVETSAYVANVDINEISERGALFRDYNRDEWEEKAKNLTTEAITYDYDFKSIEELAESLKNVDRLSVMKTVFSQITENKKNAQEKFDAILAFLQKASFHHPYRQPTFPEKRTVLDPLLILELNEMRCSQVSRLGVDIFRAGGWPARVVQLGGHVIGEVFYDNDWHYYDADLFSNGVVYKDQNGEVPSLIELSHHPEWIDSLPPTFEYICCQGEVSSISYPSYHYFSKDSYGTTKPMYYVKQKKPEDDDGFYFGWNYYDKLIDDARILYDRKAKYQPAAPLWTSAQIDKRSIFLDWEDANDQDKDLLGYHVFVSKKPRGWNYSKVSRESVKEYWSQYGPWKASQYPFLGKIPNKEVLDKFTEKSEIILENLNPGDYYITVMPEDQYGKSIGRKLYHLSAELKITIH